MKYINENIAYAKSILSKLGIERDSELWNDYLKIRDICGDSNGYVGILTKIRFIDKIEDMDEIKSIFDVLKNSKIDVNKLNKLSYNEILDMFYDELTVKTDVNDFELIYADSDYSYYRVYTYEGILKIGSPSWCLKTKKNWVEYQEAYPEQWVVINNKYRKILISPNNMYLDKYKSNKGWVRYGISYNPQKDTFVGYNDNNDRIPKITSNYTFSGVIYTIENILKGIKKSYFDYFDGGQKILEIDNYNVFRITDVDLIKNKTGFDCNSANDNYLLVSRNYSNMFILIVISDQSIASISGIVRGSNPIVINIESDFFKKIILEYARKSNSICFIGIKLNLGLVTMDDVLKTSSFLMEVGNWLVFDRDSYYLVVNKDLKDFDIPNLSLSDANYSLSNPLFWYLNKKDMTPYKSSVKHEYQKIVIDSLLDKNKKVKGFWSFLGRK